MSRTRPKRRARLLGAAAIAAATALSGCSFNGVSSLPLPGGPDLGSHPITVKIEFANVLDLVPQSAVKVNDVSVGKVEDIELAGGVPGQPGWHALVTVKMRGDVNLPDNAIATVGQTSLLGEKFVEKAPAVLERALGLEERRDVDLVLDAEQLGEIERGEHGCRFLALGH